MNADFCNYFVGPPQLTNGRSDKDMVTVHNWRERPRMFVVVSYVQFFGSSRTFFEYVGCFLP